MSSTDKLVIPAYILGSEREHNEWLRNLRTMAKQHKYLLDIIEEGTIRQTITPMFEGSSTASATGVPIEAGEPM